jgi:hypothetical protein
VSVAQDLSDALDESVMTVSGSDFADLFLDMMADTITVHPGYINHYGDFIASGTTLSLPCHIEGEVRLTRDEAGTHVASRVQALVLGNHSLTTNLHRYTLPTRFSPFQSLQAISIEKVTDEESTVYETVMLP